MEILRIPTHYAMQISYMNESDKAYIFDILMRLSIWQEIEIEKSMRWWIVLSIWTEAIQLENKANAKKWKSLKIDIAPMVQPMEQSKNILVAPKSNQIKSSQVKPNQIKSNTISKEIQQSWEEILDPPKEDKRDIDIDIIVETIKELNLWIVDDTLLKQRQYWKLIKSKMNKIKWFKWNYKEFIIMLYQNSDEYRKNHFRSLEKFYREMANIITWIKIQAEKKQIRRWC